MPDNEDTAFGFSAMTEDEMNKQSEVLEQKAKTEDSLTTNTVPIEKIDEIKNKLHGLRDMILPLLNNLSKNTEKDYILWPNRESDIKAFIDKMNNYIESN